LSTGLFSHFTERRSRPSDRKKPPRGEAERLASVFVSDDSIGARNLAKPPFRSKNFLSSSFRWNPEAFVSVAPAAGPFPSEAAIYAAAVLSAT
jgi:hypothetical protein